MAIIENTVYSDEKCLYCCARCGAQVEDTNEPFGWDKDNYGRDICRECIREISAWDLEEHWR